MRMVGKRKQKQKVSEQLYLDVFKYAPVGIYTLDINGTITSLNPQMAEIAGSKIQDTVGLNVFEMDSYRKAGLDQLFREGLKGKPFETEVKYTSQLSKKISIRYYRGVPLAGNTKPGQVKLLLMVEDVTARVKTEKKLERSRRIERLERERLLALINSVADGVVALDDKLRIIEYNGAALNLLDVNENIAGKQLGTVLHMMDKNKRRLNINKTIETITTPQTYSEWLLKYPDGETINLYLSIAPVHLGYGKLNGKGHVLLMRDISREKSLEEEKDEFISVVSHELRTPIAVAEGGISNALFVSKSSDSPPPVTNSLEEAHQQVVFLSRMINDLATLSRAERDSDHLDIDVIEPAELVKRLGNEHRDAAKDKGLQLVVSSAKDIKQLHTSELYLHEILQNFVTNAIKYTKRGSVLIHVRTGKEGQAIFSVADSGIGLSKTDQKKIFEKFFRSEDFRTRESNGTGLGLYVTAKLARKIQASIDVESELNKGSTFTITIPSLSQAEPPKT